MEALSLEKIHTPALKSIADVGAKLKVDPTQILKATLYLADGKPVLIFIRADREVNEVKLSHCLKSPLQLRLAEAHEARSMGFVVGFIGPVGLKTMPIPQILWDSSVKTRSTWIIGSNLEDYHYRGYPSPLTQPSYDLALARAGDPAPNGDGSLREMKGIEVGHIFKLGQKYTKAFNMKVLDTKGQMRTPYHGLLRYRRQSNLGYHHRTMP